MNCVIFPTHILPNTYYVKRTDAYVSILELNSVRAM